MGVLAGDNGGFPNGRRLDRRRRRHRGAGGRRLPQGQEGARSATASTRTTWRTSATSPTSRPRTQGYANAKATSRSLRCDGGPAPAGPPTAPNEPHAQAHPDRSRRHRRRRLRRALRRRSSASRRLPPRPLSPAPRRPRTSRPASRSNASTASLVAELQSRLSDEPEGRALAMSLLGLAYQQRARETGDPSYYPKSEGVLRRALALDSKDYLAVGGLGSLALSRHRFREALVLGRQADALNPYSARDLRRDRRRARRARPLSARPSGLRPR